MFNEPQIYLFFTEQTSELVGQPYADTSPQYSLL